jgi:hypothetical protein
MVRNTIIPDMVAKRILGKCSHAGRRELEAKCVTKPKEEF